MIFRFGKAISWLVCVWVCVREIYFSRWLFSVFFCAFHARLRRVNEVYSFFVRGPSAQSVDTAPDLVALIGSVPSDAIKERRPQSNSPQSQAGGREPNTTTTTRKTIRETTTATATRTTETAVETLVRFLFSLSLSLSLSLSPSVSWRLLCVGAHTRGTSSRPLSITIRFKQVGR